eukprot:874173-Rhodomonas_salina.1
MMMVGATGEERMGVGDVEERDSVHGGGVAGAYQKGSSGQAGQGVTLAGGEQGGEKRKQGRQARTRLGKAGRLLSPFPLRNMQILAAEVRTSDHRSRPVFRDGALPSLMMALDVFADADGKHSAAARRGGDHGGVDDRERETHPWGHWSDEDQDD